MKDKAKLNFTTSEVQTFRALCDELERLQKQLQDDLKPEVPRRVIDYIQNLQFQELTKTTIDRTTDAGILSDDMQRFLRFATTVKMVNKSSCDDKIQNLSQQLESGLITISSLMRRVLRENSISPPHPQDFSGLKDRLDELTRSFLKCFLEDIDKENTDGGKFKESDVDDVRNYVVVETLRDVMLLFRRDLGHLI
ncbi:uncharacterized protein LOC144642709 [Oculina patagonica]